MIKTIGNQFEITTFQLYFKMQMQKEASKEVKKNQKKDQQIKFYKKIGPFGFMSNFYSSPFAQNKKIYKTCQHYFQSKKFDGLPHELKIIEATTPAQAFTQGRIKTVPRRADWQTVKEKIMYDGLKLKFDTHKQLKAKLLQTGESKLIEHTFKDRYWADGGDGSGKNRLGILLMKLRDEYRALTKKQND